MTPGAPTLSFFMLVIKENKNNSTIHISEKSDEKLMHLEAVILQYLATGSE